MGKPSSQQRVPPQSEAGVAQGADSSDDAAALPQKSATAVPATAAEEPAEAAAAAAAKAQSAQRDAAEQPKKQPYSAEEDEAIRRGVARHGVGRWAVIMGEEPVLQGRNSDSVRCRWKTLSKRAGGWGD